jgi:hypothetical protein
LVTSTPGGFSLQLKITFPHFANLLTLFLAVQSLPKMFEGQEQVSSGSRLASHSFNDQNNDVSNFLFDTFTKWSQ